MKLTDTDIFDVKLFEPIVHEDPRGYFFEAFNQETFSQAIGENFEVCQINESCSSKETIRGLHLQQDPYSQAKLVRVVYGEVYDVAVDCRRHSETFGKYVGVILSSSNKKQLWIPRGFAHGFQVISDKCVLNYQVDNKYAPRSEIIIDAFDEDVGINWPIKSKAKMSDKDRNGVSFAAIFNQGT